MTSREAAALPAWSSRFVRDGDEEGIIELLTAAFGRWPAVETSASPLDHLRWKVASDPDAWRESSIAQTNDGRIIATQLFFAQRAKVDDSLFRLIQGVDLCVHPDYRDRGVMRDVRAFAWPTFYKVFDMRIGQTQHDALRTLATREGSRRIANHVEVLTHVRSARPTKAAPGDWTITDAGSFDERVDALWQEAAKRFRFIIARSRDYLNWRYDRRGGNYAIKIAECDGRLLGYAVLSMSHGKGNIADLLVLPDRLDVLASLVSSALEHFGRRQAAKVELWLPTHHPYREVVQDLGFRQRKRTVYMTFGAFRAPEEAVAFLDDPQAAFHFTSGDLDLV